MGSRNSRSSFHDPRRGSSSASRASDRFKRTYQLINLSIFGLKYIFQRANVPYYRLADSSPENRSSFFPEVIFTGLTCPGIEGSYQRKAIEDKMAEFTKGLKPGHKYHIHINERTGQHPKWRNQALFYDIEFLNSKGEKIFEFDSTSFLTSGTFEGVDFFNLYGFNLKENFVSFLFPKNEIDKCDILV